MAEARRGLTAEERMQELQRERLGRELIGAVGPRADLFALYENAEGRDA